MSNPGLNSMRKVQNIALASLTAIFCLFISATAMAQTALSTTTMGFGSVADNTTSATRTVGLANTQSSVKLGISSLIVSSGYTIVPGSTTCPNPGTLAPKSNCTVGVAFAPTSSGAYPGTLTINTTSPTSQLTVTLSGSGVVPTALSTATLGFGAVADNTTSPAKTVGLANAQSTVSLYISSFVASAGYVLVPGSTTCPNPGALNPGANCTIGVAFAPASSGSDPGTLTIYTNANNSPQTVTLSGTGVVATALSTTTLGFGNVADNTTSATKTVGLANTQSSASLGVSFSLATGPGGSARPASSVAPSGYILVPGSTTCPNPGTLAPKSNCTIGVAFAPTSSGSYPGTLTINTTNPTSQQTVTLSGNGVVPTALSTTTLGFGAVADNTTSPAKTVGLANTQSTVPLYISSFVASAGYVLVPGSTTCPNPGALNPGANCTIGVAFAPASPGSDPGMLTIYTNANNSPQTVTLSGTGYSTQPASTVQGQINLSNFCGGGATTPTIMVSINTSPVRSVPTDSNGEYTFTNVPNGTYTITPSIVGPSSVFYPASLTGVVVNNASVTGKNFSVALGYTVSGNVSYAGSNAGQVYLDLSNNNCGGSGGQGVSITEAALLSGGSFTIRGVPPGSYTLQAWMDNLGYGSPNAANPSGAASVSVSNANATAQAVTLVDPSVSLTGQNGPHLKQITPTDQGVMIAFSPIQNNNQLETPASYTVQWTADSTFATGISSAYFAATGNNGNVWILNNYTPGITGSFSNTTPYYFRARGTLASSQSNWSYWGSSASPASVTIGSPAGSTIQGTVYIPASVTISPNAPLYVGFYNQSSNSAYVTRIAVPNNAPTGNAYSVNVPSGSGYFNFAILDQNNDGMIDAGDVSNTNQGGSGSVTISGPLTGQDITLPSANSTASVTTQFQQNTYQGGASTSYNLNFQVREGNKLPVSATLTAGPNVVIPVDISNLCQGCGSTQFQLNAGLNNDVPSVGQEYDFLVTYNDASQETVKAYVTGWNNTSSVVGPSDLATALAPSGNNSGSTAPDFTWTYPASAGSYVYSFWISDNNGNNIWQIPGNNSKSNGFTSAQIPVPAGIQWPTDPTNSGNAPSIPNLISGNTYWWQIQTIDSNNNQAEKQVYFTVP